MQRLSIAALSERELPLSLIPPDTPCDARSHEECPPFAIITELRRAHGAVTTLLTPSLIRTLHTITQGGELLHSWLEGLSSLVPFTCLLRDTRQITT